MAINSTRRRTEVQERRRQVSEMYLAGQSMCEIADHFGVNISQISRDVKAIRQEWRSSTLANFDEKQRLELAKLDMLEAEYWKAWEDSKKKRTETYTGNTGETVRARIKKVPRDGNPSFLAGVMSCIEQRCKILGIYAATKNEHSGPNGGPIATTTLTLDEWRKQQEEAEKQAAAIWDALEDDGADSE